MARNSNSSAVRLFMLFPVVGKVSEKPAGVRTAVEMISKKPALRTFWVMTSGAP